MYIFKFILKTDYSTMVIVVAFFSLILISYTIFRFSKYPTLTLGLYFIAPFFPCDIIQIRNFLADAIILYAIGNLFVQKKRGITKYCIYICIASLIHKTALFYLMFLIPIYLKNRRKLICIVCVSSVLIGMLPQLVNKIGLVSENKMNAYLDIGRDSISSRIFLVLLIIGFTFYATFKYLNVLRKNEKTDLVTYNFTEFVCEIHVIQIILVFMIILMSFHYYRLIRNTLLLDYIVFSNFLYYEHKKNDKILLLMYIISGLLWSSINTLSQWNMIFENHLLFQYFW